MRPTLRANLERDGFALVPGMLAPHDIRTLLAALDEAPSEARATRAGALFGARNLLEVPAVRSVAALAAVEAVVHHILGDATAVRATLFDKTPAANWPVLWHQDVAIAVAEQHDVEGWGPWSVKAGVPHVHAPAAVLERMLAVRLHLDDCGPDNGPLRVLPGSHTQGRLSRSEIRDRVNNNAEIVACTAASGDALFMRPLLLHASSPARVPGHRRVLHLEFAAGNSLPAPLRWAYRTAAVPIRKELA